MDGFVAATGEPGSSWIGQVDLPDDFDEEIANTQEQMQEALNGWAAQRNNRNCNGNEIAVCKWMSLEIGYSRNRWFTMVYYHFPHENCPHFGPGWVSSQVEVGKAERQERITPWIDGSMVAHGCPVMTPQMSDVVSGVSLKSHFHGISMDVMGQLAEFLYFKV